MHKLLLMLCIVNQSFSFHFATIINLNNILTSNFDSNCFIAISNFRKIDLLPFENPTLIWQPYPERPGTLSLISIPVVCKSKYIKTFSCNTMDHILYSINSKPWRCIVEVSLYPKLNLEYVTEIPMSFTYSSYEPINHGLPSSEPTINLLIFSPEEQTNIFLAEFYVERSINRRLSDATSAMLRVDYLLALTANTAQILQINLVTLCGHCQPNYIQMVQQQLEKRLEIQNSGVQYWTFAIVSYRNDKFLESFLRHLNYCNENYKNPKFKFDTTAYQVASLWKDVLGNMTFFPQGIDSAIRCTNNIKYVDSKEWLLGYSGVIQLEIDVLYHRTSNGNPIRFSDKVRNFRFVSCGRQKRNTISFEHFTKIFDLSIWLCIIIFSELITIALGLIKIGKQKGLHVLLKTVGYIFGAYKILMEQGDSFPAKLLKILKVQVLLGPFLLVGIVLSNAYKNTNIYQMIQNLKPIPFEHIDELVNNSFEFRTTSEDLKWSRVNLYGVLWKGSDEIYVKHEFHKTSFDLSAHVLSSVSTWAMNLKSEAWSPLNPISVNGDKDFMAIANKLWNVTRIHEDSRSMISELISATSPLLQIDLWAGYQDMDIFKSMKNKYFQQEDKRLYSWLSGCSRRALVVSADFSIKYAENLKRAWHYNVYVGKEEYSQRQVVFSFKGVVTAKFLRRVKQILENGILDRAAYFINNSVGFKNDNVLPPQKPTMAGNISTVFVILASGLFWGLMTFGLEYYQLLKYFVLIALKCKTNITWLWIRQCLHLFSKMLEKYRTARNNKFDIVNIPVRTS